MTIIGTMTTGVGVVTTFNITWVPQYIHFIAATQITGLRVTVLGDGVIMVVITPKAAQNA